MRPERKGGSQRRNSRGNKAAYRISCCPEGKRTKDWGLLTSAPERALQLCDSSGGKEGRGHTVRCSFSQQGQSEECEGIQGGLFVHQKMGDKRREAESEDP